jgi:hypothetical protein
VEKDTAMFLLIRRKLEELSILDRLQSKENDQGQVQHYR